MSNEVDQERVARIIKRIEGAVKVRNTIKEYDINRLIDEYTSMLNSIITLRENEFNIDNKLLVNAVFDELKKTETISVEDIAVLRDVIKRRRERPLCSHESG